MCSMSYDMNDFSDLFEDFPELQSDGIIMMKEVCSHFGLLFSAFALLETGIQNCYVFHQLHKSLKAGGLRSEAEWRRAFEDMQKRAHDATFGSLLRLSLDIVELDHILPELAKLKKSRDYFAHHFFREENDKMFSDVSAILMLDRMNVLRRRIKAAERSVDNAQEKIFNSIYPGVGMTITLMNIMESEKADCIANPRTKFGWEH